MTTFVDSGTSTGICADNVPRECSGGGGTTGGWQVIAARSTARMAILLHGWHAPVGGADHYIADCVRDRFLVESNNEDPLAANAYGMTPLHFAVSNCNVQMVR